jgi:hypothetical protein
VPCGQPLLNWSEFPSHLEVARQKVRTKPAGDFVMWLLRTNNLGNISDEVDVQILLLKWIGVDQEEFAAEHEKMLEIQRGHEPG